MEVYVLLDRDDSFEWSIVGVVSSEKSAKDWVAFWPDVRQYETHKVEFFIALVTGQHPVEEDS
ncbi:MAG: hypothetical protein AMS21_02110 [Gemmatimonas sp. SG8_38_2]|nr:MAG: hypothetical protein AMS21_02110 [Gemmatimonas sp. SG8_38_2]